MPAQTSCVGHAIPSHVGHFVVVYCVDGLKCDRIVPVAGEIRAFFGEIFFAAGCNRLRSFKKSAIRIKLTTQSMIVLHFLMIYEIYIYKNK